MIATLVVILSLILVNALLIVLIKEISKRFANEVRANFLKRAERTGIFGITKYEETTEEDSTLDQQNNRFGLKSKENDYVPVEKVRADFKDENFKNNYKKIKRIFNYDRDDFVKNFLSKIPPTESQIVDSVKCAKNLKNKLDVDTVYQILSMERQVQEKILLDNLDKNETEILEKYLKSRDRFDLVDFINHIDEFIENNDDTLYVKTGNIKDDFSKISTRVVTEYDDNIIEGIKIIYKNKMFDHSI